MILTDFSQIISAAIYVGDASECAKNPSNDSKNMIKHSVINSVRANFMLHKKRYGQMVLACDSGSWRYDVFPQYKHQRKLKRAADTSGIKWDFVNEVKEELISDLDKFFPFPVIKLNNVEGDDCLGVISKLITETSVVGAEANMFDDVEPEDILLISSDRDNFQLHMLGKHIRQWAPMDKKLVKPVGSVRNALIEKIVKGDPGDGILNIKSTDNTFVDGIRQKPISAKYLQTFFDAKDPIDACSTDEERIHYIRNEQLVSYGKIPKDIQDSIIECYNEQCSKKHSKMQLMNYFTQNRMGNLLGQISDFYL
jgi:T4 RNase H, C terminal/5'-3' exonuclease, N-terminal resolvase-like domain